MLNVTVLENGLARIVTEHGQATLPQNLWEILASCEDAIFLTTLVAKARPLGYSNGYVRSVVQTLAQPGQYKGSSCIGAINTSTQGKRVLVQVAKDGPAAARARLTRNTAPKSEEA